MCHIPLGGHLLVINNVDEYLQLESYDVGDNI